ncbi:hypothetical protein CDL12_27242 [Handroanthus impetiginosus]|uniref:3'-5' exonuclease domain-containing protein n=1 Tax=Handroanthus impetiginosus TaxID=429701 RepID=A0A2G9G4Y0_9LAMI|nr:hypothetical protein CDL12_27242 [Handroanthus impetiginosus]
MEPNHRIEPFQTYAISFYNDEIDTTVTSDCDTVERWINEIPRPNLFIVGVDIKYRYDDLKDFVSTVQLCVGSRCLIYQLEFVDYDFPDVLLDFLANEEYTFVGWDIDYSLTRLETETALDIPRALVVDLMNLAGYRSLNNMDMLEYIFFDDPDCIELAEMVLEKELEDMPEEVLMLRWDLRQLTSEQVKYACVDAFVAFEMGRILNARQYRLTGL